MALPAFMWIFRYCPFLFSGKLRFWRKIFVRVLEGEFHQNRKKKNLPQISALKIQYFVKFCLTQDIPFPAGGFSVSCPAVDNRNHLRTRYGRLWGFFKGRALAIILIWPPDFAECFGVGVGHVLCSCLFHGFTVYPVRRFGEVRAVYFPVAIHTERNQVLFYAAPAVRAGYYVVDLYRPAAVTDSIPVIVTGVHVFADFCGQQLLCDMRCAPLGSCTGIRSILWAVTLCPARAGVRAYPRSGR